LKREPKLPGNSAAFVRRILVVDDEQLTRTLIAGLLAGSNFEVNTCGSALEAMGLVESFDPDALIVDISLGTGPSGIDLVQALKHSKPHLSFMVLSNYAAAPASIKGLQNVAYLQKNAISESSILIEALNSILSNNTNESQYPFAIPEKVAGLTTQQLEVLSWISDGLSNQEIANRRNTTLESCEQMIGRIYKKLGLERNGSRSLRVQATAIYRTIISNNQQR
jgi:DNA-binding NarL/FixJ family response regulator